MTNIYRVIQQESAKLCGYINQVVLSKMNPITMGLFSFLPIIISTVIESAVNAVKWSVQNNSECIYLPTLQAGTE